MGFRNSRPLVCRTGLGSRIIARVGWVHKVNILRIILRKSDLGAVNIQSDSSIEQFKKKRSPYFRGKDASPRRPGPGLPDRGERLPPNVRTLNPGETAETRARIVPLRKFILLAHHSLDSIFFPFLQTVSNGERAIAKCGGNERILQLAGRDGPPGRPRPPRRGVPASKLNASPLWDSSIGPHIQKLQSREERPTSRLLARHLHGILNAAQTIFLPQKPARPSRSTPLRPAQA